jgi:hypothetical protein
MRIHRERYLVAAAAIAAGCGVTATTTPTATPLVIAPAAPPPPPEASAAPKPNAPLSPVTEGDGNTDGPSTEGGPSVEGGPSAEGYPSSEGTTGAWSPQCRDTSTVTRPVGCSDTIGVPDDCKKAFCRSTPFICQHCEDYKRYFKPHVAERAVACVIGQTQREADDGCKTYRCGDLALKSACLDPAADAMCTRIARACKTSLDECRGVLSGMNDAGRQQIATCAAQGCPYGLWSCVEGI